MLAVVVEDDKLFHDRLRGVRVSCSCVAMAALRRGNQQAEEGVAHEEPSRGPQRCLSKQAGEPGVGGAARGIGTPWSWPTLGVGAVVGVYGRGIGLRLACWPSLH